MTNNRLKMKNLAKQPKILIVFQSFSLSGPESKTKQTIYTNRNDEQNTSFNNMLG